MPPPAQRETYCHECLTENPRTRATCVNCGARLRHPKEFAQDMAERTHSVSVATFGNVGAAIFAALYGVVVAVLLPQWLGENLVGFAIGGIVALAIGRLAGRFLARQVNDSTV